MEKIIESGAVVFDGCTFTNTKVEVEKTSIWHSPSEESEIKPRELLLVQGIDGSYDVAWYERNVFVTVAEEDGFEAKYVKRWCYLNDLLALAN